MRHLTHDSRFSREIRFNEKPSLTETILETLGQTGMRPAFHGPAAGRRTQAGRIAVGLAVVLAVATLGLTLLRTSPSDPLPVASEPVAVLELVRGSVGMLPASAGRDPSRFLALDAGAAIHAGAVIETGSGQARRSRAALRLAGGGSLRLDADTRLRVASSNLLELERGAVYLDSGVAGAGVEVRTTLGLVRDIGTQFEVRLDAEAALRVRVREGSVVLELGGESHEAAAGTELAVDGEGVLARGTVPIWGPQWDWVLETAPAPDIAGRPLAVFLDWIAREGGWTVRFADPETAALAATTILHGDVENLTPAEASSMVFQSSGLGYRIEDGTFFVGPFNHRPSGRAPGKAR